MSEMSFIKTARQSAAIDAMIHFVEVMLEGGSRSGKTFIAIYSIVVRAVKYPGSRHLVVRKHIAHIKAAIWKQTLPDVLKKCFPDMTYNTHEQDMTITLPNGSMLVCAGSDDKERIEKVLGTEWDTIALDEVSQQAYQTYELFKTRLNPSKGVKPLLLLMQNPPSMSHWTFIKFHKALNPETMQPLSAKDAARQTFIKMNPGDNIANLSEGYIDTLESMSESRKRRFLLGEYGDDAENALWKREWIIRNRIDALPSFMDQVVVAVDPAVTGNASSDAAGIVVCGKYRIGDQYHFVIINDATYHGDVGGWGMIACQQYEIHKANKIVAEVNQGGDLVRMNIRNYNPNVSYDDVRATRGKALRAEPIADLYRMGRVHHYGEFLELEDELCTWTPESSDSPNRLDACVWGLAYLSGALDEYATVIRHNYDAGHIPVTHADEYASVTRY